MDWVKEFFLQNFFLICISVFLIVNSIIRYKQYKRISLFTISIVSLAFLLAVITLFQDYGRVKAIEPLAVSMTVLGYILRPVELGFFILMSNTGFKGKLSFLNYILLIVNVIVYIFAFIPITRDALFHYEVITEGEKAGQLLYVGGPVRFCSHIISTIYLAYIIYVSFMSISSKHLAHGLTILTCSLFVILAVVLEAFFNKENDKYLLNTTIVIGAMCYYLYLYIEMTQIDTATGLFNRETYYRDMLKIDKNLSGVIEFDMNGLKYINDNFGHLEGDKALSKIAKVINQCSKRNMTAYRVGGDEFIILMVGGSEQDLIKVVESFKEEMSKTSYYCSTGYAYRNNKEKSISIEDLIKEAEKMMYKDKEEFYKSSPFKRRKADQL